MKKRLGHDSRIKLTSSLAAAISSSHFASPNYENTDALFDRKIDLVTERIDQFFASKLRILPKHNALTIIDYVLALKNEINLSDGYRRLNIYVLYSISKFFENKKTYKEITRDEILQYLDSLRKSEALDPLHRWIGTYNVYRVILIRFFKWLYYQDIEPKKRPKPSVIENISHLKRKEQSVYKPSDCVLTRGRNAIIQYPEI